jgi:LPXTG-site transpeptidase (sortase) family protein
MRLARGAASATATLVLGFVLLAYVGGPTGAERDARASLEEGRAATRSAVSEPPAPPHGGIAGRSPRGGLGRTAGQTPAEGGDPGPNVWAEPRRRFVPIGHLSVPRIGLEHRFYVGIHDEVVRRGPGLWPGTPLPGRSGNAVFAGHRTTHTHPFRDLDLLRPGDAIRTRLRGGKATTFTVVRSAVVPEASYARFVLRPPARPRVRMITLFACTPKGQRSHRIVVRARAAALQGRGEDAGAQRI